MPVPDFKEVFKNYDRFDVGAIGEFDVAVLVDQYAGADVSHQMYPHWRGGYYYAARPKGDSAAPLALIYVSRWSDHESASQFASIYAKASPSAISTCVTLMKMPADGQKSGNEPRYSNFCAGKTFRQAHMAHRRRASCH